MSRDRPATWDVIRASPPSGSGSVLYPGVPLELDSRKFEPEKDDGLGIVEFEAAKVIVTAGGVKVFEVGTGEIRGYLTSSRFVVFCAQHSGDKQQLRRFPHFVASGHIRWPWLGSVGVSPPSGGLRRLPERLQLRTVDGTLQADTGKIRHIALVMHEPTIPAAELARDIYQRAIKFRLEHEPGTRERGWEKLLNAPEEASLDKFSYFVVPEFFYARADMPPAYQDA